MFLSMLSVTNTNPYLSPDDKDDDDVGADDAKSVDSLASATSVTIKLNGHPQTNTYDVIPAASIYSISMSTSKLAGSSPSSTSCCSCSHSGEDIDSESDS